MGLTLGDQKMSKRAYRYRMTQYASRHVAKAAERVLPRLGKILRIKAYRVRTNREGVWTDREQLMVVGENGSARFNGCCWGYGGEGPRAVHHVLTLCGLDKETADKLAYHSDRLNRDGVDWEWKAA